MLEQLIQECLAGRRQSQNELYHLFAGQMLGVCMRYSSTRAGAEDILQEGFIKMFTYLHQFQHQGSFEGWVRKIMVNCALNRYRQNSFAYSMISTAHPNFTEIPDKSDIFSRLEMKHLLQLIQELPPVYRMVFNLYVFEGMKHKEIALAMGISEGTSKSNLHDARNLLQKNLMNELNEGVYQKAV